jgi:hypothetical protein
MADEEGSDLISNISITGGDEAASKLKDFSDKGAAALDHLNESAQRAASGVAKASDDISGSGAKVSKSLDDTGKSVDGLNSKKVDPAGAKGIDAMAESSGKLGTDIRKTTIALGEFIARVSAVSLLGVAAGEKLLKLGTTVAAAIKGTSDAQDKATAAQVQANNTQLAATTGAINYQSEQDKLLRQMILGKITWQQYDQSVKDLRDNYKEQVKVANEVARAQEAVRVENERLQKQLADRKVYDALIEKYGGPLTGSLNALGQVVGNLTKQFKDAFGPAASDGVDLVTSIIAKNGSEISKFFDDAAKKFDQFIKSNGPAIKRAIESIGTGLKAAFNGVIEALPSLIAFFNNVLVPALRAIGDVAQKVADGINKAFGSDVNASFVLIVFGLTRMLGGFRLIFDLVKTGGALFGLSMGPWLIVIAAIIAALAILAVTVDWKAFAERAVDAASKMKAAFFEFVDNVKKVFTDFVKNVKDDWNGLSQSTQELWDKIKQGAVDMWDAIVAYFTAKVEAVKKFFTDIWDWASEKFNQIIQKAQEAARDTAQAFDQATSSDGGQGGASANTNGFASGGMVRGPGTSTSDSIIARLSNNEFVVQAKSVARYGVNFMNALNQGKLNFTAPLRGFAMGGLVDIGSGVPAFAKGGVVAPAPGRPFNLHIGDQSFKGLTAPEHVAERLTKFAIQRQTASAGRKPGWLGS